MLPFVTTLTSLDSSIDSALVGFFLTTTGSGGGDAAALDAFLFPFFIGAGGGEGDLALALLPLVFLVSTTSYFLATSSLDLPLLTCFFSALAEAFFGGIYKKFRFFKSDSF